MSRKKLFAASKAFVKTRNEHCIVLTLSQDKTTLEASGDEVWIKAALERPDVFEKLRDALCTAAEQIESGGELQHVKFPKTYPKLFACPGTKKWKGVQIRSQLSKYLAFHGYGHNMPMRYGEDEPPVGWPVLVDWSKFRGPSKSCSMALCTEIIMQLMEVQGLKPMEHYIRTENTESDDSDDEEDISENEANGEEVEAHGNKRKEQMISKNVVETIAHVQEMEERHGSAFKRRRRNIEELKEGLKTLEEGELLEDD